MKLSIAAKIGMVAVSVALAGSCAVNAQDNQATNTADQGNITLEDLINIDVTTVSRRDTKLNQTPAAIYVITPEEIERSGATGIQDALRLAPGLDVAQINSSQWAISSRGFNSQFANKLLVLEDGRSIYNYGFGGALWDMQYLMLEDLNRIEVIRGPGATLWGANAENGVINIISKSAKDTQGLLVSSSFGTEQQPATSVRYGGTLGTNLYYRVYGQYANQEGFVDATGHEEPDDRNLGHGGARLDWEPTDNDLFTLQGDYFRADFGGQAVSPSLAPPYSTMFNGLNNKVAYNALGRWSHDFSAASQFSLQTFYDYSLDNDALIRSAQHVYDLDLQQRFGLWDWQDIVVGAGFRYVWDNSPPSFDLTYTPPIGHQSIYSAFVQDDLTLVPDHVHAILGSKFEHNPDTGFEVQPSGRLMWTPNEQQTFWGSVSRAVRTPSRFDTDSAYNLSVIPPSPPGNPLPTLITIYGNPAFQSEELIAYELGWRYEPTPRMSFDLAAFYNVYNDLNSTVSGAPVFVAAPVPHIVVPQMTVNGLSGQTYGGEASVQWRILDSWKVQGSYSRLHMNLNPNDLTAGDSPQNQFQIHSYLNLPANLEFNGAIYYVDSLPDQNVGAYARVDAGLVWRPSRAWEFSVWGLNLVDNRHEEFGNYRYPVPSEVPRSCYAKATWRF